MGDLCSLERKVPDFLKTHPTFVLGAPSKLKISKKHDIVQKGGRGLCQNPSISYLERRTCPTEGRGAVMYCHPLRLWERVNFLGYFRNNHE